MALSLSVDQLDSLKEIGNIGAGNAATALGQLLDKKIFINVPKVKLMQFNELAESDFLPHSDEIGLAISSNILGSLKGGMLVLYSHNSALSLIDILTKREAKTTQFFNLMDASALLEASNILCCSYLNAVTEFLKLYKLIPSVSQLYMDRMDKLTESLVKNFIKSDIGYLLPIENYLTIDNVELNLYIIFLLNLESVNQILKTVGL